MLASLLGRGRRFETVLPLAARQHWRSGMKRINLCASAAIFWALLAAPSSSSGASLVLPVGLNPGDQYRIAFLTSDVRDGTSANIADYDLFVTGEANAAGSVLQPLGTTWQAIASTLTVDAFTHIGGNFSV